jgi:hypothetical protein
MNALTRIPDRRADYEIYFVLHANRRPAIMMHEWSDLVGGQPKFLEALTLLRTITGSKAGLEAEQGMMNSAAHMLGEDGLYYQPVYGRPWSLRGTLGNDVSWAKDPAVLRTGQFADPYPTGRLLLAMALWYERDKNLFWREMAERMIARVAQVAVDKDDFAYLAPPFIHPGYHILQPDPRTYALLQAYPPRAGSAVGGQIRPLHERPLAFLRCPGPCRHRLPFSCGHPKSAGDA